MRRGFWFVAGAGAGVYATVRARRLAEAFTPVGMRDRFAGLSLGAQLFSDEVRTGMAEKESQLRDRFDLALENAPTKSPRGRGPHAERHRALAPAERVEALAAASTDHRERD